jgi:hypothetical protein
LAAQSLNGIPIKEFKMLNLAKITKIKNKGCTGRKKEDIKSTPSIFKNDLKRTREPREV